MALTDNLESILKAQKDAVSDLEKELKVLASSDLTKENSLLKEELALLKEEHEKAKSALKAAKDENTGLKNALYEQIYSEKLSILNMSAKKLDIYFGSSNAQGMNRLNDFERNARSRIDEIYKELQRSHVDLSDDIYNKLAELSSTLNEKITQARMKYSETSGAFSDTVKAKYEALKSEQITDEQVKAVSKKNNIEAFIGQNLINKIGIFLIIIGVIAASQYTYVRLTDMLKGICMFALGSIMLVAGEILNRKKPNVFSLGITSGGVAVLYVAMSVSYFRLGILSMYPAITICVLVTAVSLILSLRYNSQTIASFALIGGYLPIFSISGNLTMIYGAMVYFMVLNLFALGISFKKKWEISSFIGLVLNIAGTIYIMRSTISEIHNLTFGINQMVLLGYISIAFLIYTFIPVVSNYKTSMRFKVSDVVLLGINTFMSSIIMYYVFYEFNLDKFTGLLSILFAIVYLFMGRFIETKFENEKNATALFYLTGLAFVVLIVPFQFGKAWVSLGWLAEGVAITTYGILQKEKSFRRSGFAINFLCLGSFIVLDVLLHVDDLFAYKYLAITLGSLIILFAYIYKSEQFGKFQKVYKYITIINLWLYAIYISGKLGDSLNVVLAKTPDFSECLVLTMILVETFLIAYAIKRIKRIADFGTKVISIVLYFIGALLILILNSNNVFTYTGEGNMPLVITVAGTITLIFANLLAVLAVNDLTRGFVMDKVLKVEWYPLIVSATFVILLTQNLIVQYSLEFSNMLISIIYAVTALLWIIFGFIKKYTFIRRFGLGLAVLSVVKLFIVDLSYLTLGYKIVAYFALGISLVAISFVYQYFSKRLEISEGVKNND